jgi:hypothetical protein
MGGPAALVALAGLGAVAATEYGGAGRGRQVTQADLDRLGQPSEAALQMLKRLDEEPATGGTAAESGQASETASDTGTDPATDPATQQGTPPDKPIIL